MSTDDPHRLGYLGVDADPHADVLLDAMRATAQLDAPRWLRAWEREQLRLRPGERLLDVGCGLGEAALALAGDLGDHGEIVGIDASERMVAAARAAGRSAACRVRFEVGDAASLDAPVAAFDAVRSERTLQWLPDPAAAVAEMVRVLRPGGRLSLIDTDWSTFRLDVGDPALAALVEDGMREERGRPSTVGRRLVELVVAAGCSPTASTQATQTWDAWDPDASPAPDGCFSMASLVDDLVESGRLAPASRDETLATIATAARDGRFAMRLTMFAVCATRP